MARRRRRFTVSRAFVVLLLAIGVGAWLYLSERIRPENLREQLREAAQGVLTEQADLDFDEISIDIDGVDLRGVRVLYPDGDAAIMAERVFLTVDHKELFAGNVDIRQVDVWGLVCRLRVPEPGAAPEFPGVFKASDGDAVGIPKNLPRIRLRGGQGGSRLEVHNSDLLAPGVPLRLSCESADGLPDGPLYRVTAHFHGERVRLIKLDLELDTLNKTLDVRTDVQAITWERGDTRLLARKLRDVLPPIELAGAADFKARTTYDLARKESRRIVADGKLRKLEGSFGNIHTNDPAGLPFGVTDGRADVRWDAGVLDVSNVKVAYISPKDQREGVEPDDLPGALEASLRVDFRRVEPHLDVWLKGSAIYAETDDLRLLLPPDAVESMVEQFLPRGKFDFELTISQRPLLPEKVIAKLRLSEGNVIYAGRLDELTGERFGFYYPIDNAEGEIDIETHVPTARGLTDRIDIRNLRGSRAIASDDPNAPKNVKVVANGRIRGYTLPDGAYREDVKIAIDVRDLPIDRKLAAAFAKTPRGSPYEAFDLTGWASRVQISVEQDAFVDEEPITTYDVTLRDCSMAYEEFPLRVENVSGNIISRDRRPDEQGRRWRELELRDLRGRARDGGAITGRGLVMQSDDGTENIDLAIEAADLVIGPDLERALRASSLEDTGVVDLWTKLRPYGKIAGALKMHGPDDPEIRIDLGGTTSLRGYEDVDCPCTDLEGEIHFRNGVASLRDIRGKLAGQPFHLQGRVAEFGKFDLEGSVDGLTLRRDVRRLVAALAPEAAAGLELLALEDASQLRVSMKVSRARTNAPLVWTADLDDLDLRSAMFNLPVRIRGGPVSIQSDRITANQLWLRSGDGEVKVKELVLPRADTDRGWARVEARNLHPVEHLEPVLGPGIREVLGDNIRIDLTEFRIEFDRFHRAIIFSGPVDLRRHELRAALPDVLEPTGALGLSPLTLKLPENPDDPLRFSGVIEFRDVNLNIPIDAKDMTGELRIAEGTLGPFTLKGAVLGARVDIWERELEDLSLNLTFDPHYLRIGNIAGKFYGGSCRGDVEVHLAEPGAFKVRWRAEGVQLGEMLKEDMPRGKEMAGSMNFAIDVESASGLPQHMSGRGEVTVRDGKLFEVPGLRRLLSVLSRVTPFEDNPNFREADMDFTINGENIEIRRVHLSTKTNDVLASGVVTIYGDLDLVVQPQVNRLLDWPRLIDIPFLTTMRAIWHRTVYEIRLQGTLDSPAIGLRALPFLKRKKRPFTQSPHAGRAKSIRPRLLP